jgi:hypothetical protein
MIKFLLTFVFVGLWQFSCFAQCKETPKALPAPSEKEMQEFVIYLNVTGLPLDITGHAPDTCKTIYSIRDDSNCDPKDANYRWCNRWKIAGGCEFGALYSLFKGDIDNDGIQDYIFAGEGGSGHFDGLEATYHKEKNTFVAIHFDDHKNSRTLLPGIEVASEAVALPGQLGDPFLTTACGSVLMNFVDYNKWNVEDNPKLHSEKYLWKNGKLKRWK